MRAASHWRHALETKEAAVLGGKARARSLTAEERSGGARLAALARWGGAPLPKATHAGVLRIGEIEIDCFVIEDGRRVISQSGMSKAIGTSKGGTRKVAGDRIANFLAGNAIKPFVPPHLTTIPELVIRFIVPQGGQAANGYEAHLLGDICNAIVAARVAGAIGVQHERIWTRAAILVKAFTNLGISALVDEATGFQESRDKQALQALLDRYLRQELAAWAKRFPDEFYQQIFRLKRWEWKGMHVNRPQVVAYYTKDCVYARLAPGVLRELEQRTPTDQDGRRKARLHQWLTDDVGCPALSQHLHAVIGLMRISGDWDQFMRHLDHAFPRRGDTLQLSFMTEVPIAEA